MSEKIKAKKSLGQNFLIDETLLEKIATSIEIQNKNILEIGPGYGALTKWIAGENYNHLDLVELDDDMIPRLEADFGAYKNLSIHHGDILQYTQSFLPFSVIANIPYYITSPILMQFLYPEDVSQIPDEMVILMQKEVAEKIQSKNPRKKIKNSLFSLIMHEACNSIEYLFDVPRTAFRPAPKVDSAILKFIPKKERDFDYENQKIALWKQAFIMPRKTLLSNLKNFHDKETIEDVLMMLGHKSNIRAEALSSEEWDTFISFL